MSDVDRKMIRARVRLILDNPFFGNLAMNLKLVQREGLRYKSMCVDTKGNVYYDPGFVTALDVEELSFVICHEVLHLAFNHMTRRGGRSQERWYRACDFAINSILINSPKVGRMPTGNFKGLHDPKYDGWSAEKIYNDLPEPEDERKVACSGGEGSGNEEGEAEGSGSRSSGNEQVSGGGFDAHSETGGHPGQDRTEIEDVWKGNVARAAATARMQGKMPGGLEELINGLLYPKVDWRTVLWQFVNKVTKEDYRWYPPNRRHVHNGYYLPSMRSETFEVAVAIDTSGSISTEELAQFLSELRAILEMNPSCTVHAYECDADVHKYREYHAGDDMDLKVTGRGGTDFRPVFTDVDRKGLDIACLVYLTDGMGDYPDCEPSYPVLWILTEKYNVPFGEKVIMNGN